MKTPGALRLSARGEDQPTFLHILYRNTTYSNTPEQAKVVDFHQEMYHFYIWTAVVWTGFCQGGGRSQSHLFQFRVETTPEQNWVTSRTFQGHGGGDD